MNSIKALKLDYNSQIEELDKIHNQKLSDNCAAPNLEAVLQQVRGMNRNEFPFYWWK